MNLNCYISGPMAGKPDDNKPAFMAAEKWLIENGYVPVNPFFVQKTICPKPQKLSDYLKDDYCQICHCGSILMLDGWQYSEGAKRELRVALDLEITVLFENQIRKGE